MYQPLRLLTLTSAAVLLVSCAPIDTDRDRWSYCGRDVRVQVTDLDMSPDPVSEGQRVRAWKVRLRADERTRCDTVLQIRERPGNELVGRERLSRLRGGVNEIEIEPVEGYRFSRDEHCFVVLANIEGTGRPVDAARRFCARRISGKRWTLRG
ncbi:MAG TPA: hypothetical protein VNL14_10235 [Candidatus Acidoferrales bacterium]|nr:hypothetical protein [Candidatus Acidoferrales bacterium]